MSDYSLPETITLLNQVLIYEERGCYHSDVSSVLEIVAWVPMSTMWMVNVSNKGVRIFDAQGSTFLEMEKNLNEAVKEYMAGNETFMKILAGALQ